MSIAAQLTELLAARGLLASKCNEIGASVADGATLRQCEAALCSLAGVAGGTAAQSQVAELEAVRADLAAAANRLDCELPQTATIREIAEALHDTGAPVPLAGDAYAVITYNGTNSSESIMYFTRSTTPIPSSRMYHGQTTRGVYTGFEDSEYASMSSTPWNTNGLRVVKVVFEDTIRPSSCAWWFSNFQVCKEFEHLERLDLSQCRSLWRTFNVCQKLPALDLSGHDLSSVESMSYMCNGCKAMTDFVLGGADVGKVRDISYMLYQCGALLRADLSGLRFDSLEVATMLCSGCTLLGTIDTEGMVFGGACTDYSYMFRGCSSLFSLDLSGLGRSGATKITYMFYGCSALRTIYVPEGTDWSGLTGVSATYAFTNCENLVGGNGTWFTSTYQAATYARVDGLGGRPGYFTAKAG